MKHQGNGKIVKLPKVDGFMGHRERRGTRGHAEDRKKPLEATVEDFTIDSKEDWKRKRDVRHYMKATFSLQNMKSENG